MYNTKMDPIFMNSKSSKTCDPHRLLLNVTDKINLKRNNNYVALLSLILSIYRAYWAISSIYCTWKNI